MIPAAAGQADSIRAEHVRSRTDQNAAEPDGGSGRRRRRGREARPALSSRLTACNGVRELTYACRLAGLLRILSRYTHSPSHLALVSTRLAISPHRVPPSRRVGPTALQPSLLGQESCSLSSRLQKMAQQLLGDALGSRPALPPSASLLLAHAVSLSRSAPLRQLCFPSHVTQRLRRLGLQFITGAKRDFRNKSAFAGEIPVGTAFARANPCLRIRPLPPRHPLHTHNRNRQVEQPFLEPRRHLSQQCRTCL